MSQAKQIKQQRFDHNRGILESRWPHVWEKLRNPRWTVRLKRLDDKPDGPLVANGFRLASAFDPIGEARVQAESIPDMAEEAWVYGVGHGDLIRVLLERDALRKLYVVVLNPGALLNSLNELDHTDWCADPRVHLEIPSPETTVQRPFAASPTCLKLVPVGDPMEKLRDQIHLELATPFINRDYQKNTLMRERLEENRPFIKNDGDVAQLFDTQVGKPILVVGAGPTLGRHLPELRALIGQGGCKLIAVDSALHALKRAEIEPDIVISIDPYPEVFFLFDGVGRMPGCQLVYFPLLDGAVLQRWSGRRLCAYTSSEIYQKVSESFPKGRLFSAGVVFHPAVDLAVRMGASDVVMFGADFGFPSQETHAHGSPAQRSVSRAPSSDLLQNGDGEVIRTIPVYRNALRDLERYIGIPRERPVHFWNASRRGARIDGCRFLDHGDLLKGLTLKPESAERSGKVLRAASLAQMRRPQLEADALLKQGLRLVRQGYLVQAEEYLETVREMVPALKDAMVEMSVELGLGELMTRHGRLEKADQHLKRSQRLAERERHVLHEAKSRRGLAEMYIRTRDWQKAAELLENALGILRAMDNPVEEAQTRRVMSSFFLANGRPEEARKNLELAVMVLRELHDEWGEAECQLDLAEVMQRQNQMDEAEEALRRALALHESRGDQAGMAMARDRLFVLHLEYGRQGGADRNDCRRFLERSATALRRGMDAQGAEHMTRLIDCILNNLKSGRLRLTPQQINPLLLEMAEQQKRQDSLAVADLLEHKIAHVLFGE
ncbi:MAG: DUF115 domain-containing protein [Magnetococcales bacterium]|nr:DUF115 domain-containing protein [Magnetococcales bacterium]